MSTPNEYRIVPTLGSAVRGAGALETNSVLRNTYLLLALTMVPTILGASLGMAT